MHSFGAFNILFSRYLSIKENYIKIYGPILHMLIEAVLLLRQVSHLVSCVFYVKFVSILEDGISF